MQEALFDSGIGPLLDRPSSKHINLIIHNASVWTGDDQVHLVEATHHWKMPKCMPELLCLAELHEIVYCCNHPTMQVTTAEALAIQADGHLAAVGGNAHVLQLQQSATQVTDYHGAFVMPVSLQYMTH